MGCKPSKFDNHNIVRQCEDRRRLIKEVVHARHQLIAAAEGYRSSVLQVASALSSFASHERLSISDRMVSVDAISPAVIVPSPPNRHLSNVPSSTHRGGEAKDPSHLSSPFASPQTIKSTFNAAFRFAPTSKLVHSRTAPDLRSCTLWNWESFHPPNSAQQSSTLWKDHLQRSRNSDCNIGSEQIEFGTEYDFYDRTIYSSKETGHGRGVVDGDYEREEMECSEWGDCCSTTGTSTSEESEDDGASEPEFEPGQFTSVPFIGSKSLEQQLPGQESEIGEPLDGTSENIGMLLAEDVKEVVLVAAAPAPTPTSTPWRHKDLKEMVDCINTEFKTASMAVGHVLHVLDVERSKLHQLSSVPANLSSSWTSTAKMPSKYLLQLETSSVDDSGGSKTLSSTLERLRELEKKLFQEVKNREAVKFELQKKLIRLRVLESGGEDEVKIDKMKTSVMRLRSLLIVTSQTVSTTSAIIIGLRDQDLVPQLLELCHGFISMWRSMQLSQEQQSRIAVQVRFLVFQAKEVELTTEPHRQATRDLETAVSNWQLFFRQLMKYQHELVSSLHCWYKLTLLSVNRNGTSLENSNDNVLIFLNEWKLALTSVTESTASEAIESFLNLVHEIVIRQTQELKMKRQIEVARKELEKKASVIGNIERTRGSDAQLAVKKVELEMCQSRVEEEVQRHLGAVKVTRAITHSNLQKGLPEVFQALAKFSSYSLQALEAICLQPL